MLQYLVFPTSEQQTMINNKIYITEDYTMTKFTKPISACIAIVLVLLCVLPITAFASGNSSNAPASTNIDNFTIKVSTKNIIFTFWVKNKDFCVVRCQV